MDLRHFFVKWKMWHVVKSNQNGIHAWIMSFGRVTKFQNFRRIFVVVFLKCSCEINFRAPSRYQKRFCDCNKNIPQWFVPFFWHSKKTKKEINSQILAPISTFDNPSKWDERHIKRKIIFTVVCVATPSFSDVKNGKT